MVYIILRNEKLVDPESVLCCQSYKTAFHLLSKRTLFPCFCETRPLVTKLAEPLSAQKAAIEGNIVSSSGVTVLFHAARQKTGFTSEGSLKQNIIFSVFTTSHFSTEG